MTENTTTDRTELVSKHVGDALHDGFMMIYERLDNLHKRGIDDGEVIQALHNLGEEKLLEAYAEWAEIDLHPGDNNITMDPVVPDPYDAGSYKDMPGTEFTGRDLMDLLLPEFPTTYVEQTGGGTATLMASKNPGDVVIACGPGSYNWTSPAFSTFNTGDFYIGPWEDDDHPGFGLGPASSLAEIADKIRATYQQHNNTEGAAA